MGGSHKNVMLPQVSGNVDTLCYCKCHSWVDHVDMLSYCKCQVIWSVILPQVSGDADVLSYRKCRAMRICYATASIANEQVM